MLRGYKTYICAGVLLLAFGTSAAGWITNDQLKIIQDIFVPLAIAAMREAIGSE